MTRAHTHLVRLGAAGLASAALVATLAGAAEATPPTSGTNGTGATVGTSGNSGPSAVPATLAGIKAKASADVTDRVNDLNAAITRVNSTQGLGSGQSTLDTYLGADISPLQQLNQTIQSDATVPQAAKDFSTIFSGFRVYLLVLPAAWIATDADHATATAIPSLTAASARAQAHVNPSNQAELQPLIDDLNGQIGAATNATNGLAANVLAFTPTQWNANHDLLSSSRASQQAAHNALTKGRSDVRQIAADLLGEGAAPGLRGAGLGGHRGASVTTTTTSSTSPTSAVSG